MFSTPYKSSLVIFTDPILARGVVEIVLSFTVFQPSIGDLSNDMPQGRGLYYTKLNLSLLTPFKRGRNIIVPHTKLYNRFGGDILLISEYIPNLSNFTSTFLDTLYNNEGENYFIRGRIICANKSVSFV